MIRWQRSAVALAVVAAVTTACSDSGSNTAAASSAPASSSSAATSSSAAGSSAADASPVCAAAGELRTSVDQLTQVDVTQGGLAAFGTALTAVSTAVSQLVDTTSSQLQPAKAGLQTDLTAIRDALDAATADPSVAALRTVGSTLTTLVGDVGALATDLGGSC